jgi:hypothetical protein
MQRFLIKPYGATKLWVSVQNRSRHDEVKVPVLPLLESNLGRPARSLVTILTELLRKVVFVHDLQKTHNGRRVISSSSYLSPPKLLYGFRLNLVLRSTLKVVRRFTSVSCRSRSRVILQKLIVT